MLAIAAALVWPGDKTPRVGLLALRLGRRLDCCATPVDVVRCGCVDLLFFVSSADYFDNCTSLPPLAFLIAPANSQMPGPALSSTRVCLAF